jgi:hypothetical protein
MALFGAPLAHEDHAVRPCYAVLRLQEASKPCTTWTIRAPSNTTTPSRTRVRPPAKPTI